MSWAAYEQSQLEMKQREQAEMEAYIAKMLTETAAKEERRTHGEALLKAEQIRKHQEQEAHFAALMVSYGLADAPPTPTPTPTPTPPPTPEQTPDLTATDYLTLDPLDSETDPDIDPVTGLRILPDDAPEDQRFRYSVQHHNMARLASGKEALSKEQEKLKEEQARVARRQARIADLEKAVTERTLECQLYMAYLKESDKDPANAPWKTIDELKAEHKATESI